MAADNPEVAFEMEADVFTLKRSSAGVEFIVNGTSYSKDLPGAKINRETGELLVMGNSAGKVDDSCDTEALASTLESWYPPGAVEHIHNLAEFDSKKANGIVVGKFSAEWCGPCKMVAPKIDAMSLKYPDVKFIHIDGDKCKDLMRREGAKAFPTFMFWVDGAKQAGKKVEGADAGAVEQIIKELGAQAQEVESEAVADETVSISCQRDSFVFKKEGSGVSVTINGDLVFPPGKCPGVEIDLATRKVTIGRGGGVIFDSPNYNVEDVMNSLKAMFPTAVVHISSMQQFDDLLKNNDVVLGKFSASWCGPCKAIAPKYNELSLEYPNIVFTHVDVEEVRQLGMRERIEAMPTFIFYEKGKRNASKFVRGANIAQVEKYIKSY